MVRDFHKFRGADGNVARAAFAGSSSASIDLDSCWKLMEVELYLLLIRVQL